MFYFKEGVRGVSEAERSSPYSAFLQTEYINRLTK